MLSWFHLCSLVSFKLFLEVLSHLILFTLLPFLHSELHFLLVRSFSKLLLKYGPFATFRKKRKHYWAVSDHGMCTVEVVKSNLRVRLVHTHQQTCAWLGWWNQLAVIVHIFLQLAVDTQLLPVSPKYFQTPAVSCLHSCSFHLSLPETFKKNCRRKTEVCSSPVHSTSAQSADVSGLLFFRKFWKRGNQSLRHICYVITGSLKKKHFQ